MRLVPGSLARVFDMYDRNPPRVALGALPELLESDYGVVFRKHVEAGAGMPTLVLAHAVEKGSGLSATVVAAAGVAVPVWVYDDELRGVGHGHAGGRVLHEERTVVHRPP